MRPEVLPYVVDWRNDPSNAQWFLTAATFTMPAQIQWYEARKASPTEVNWTIESLSGQPLGTVAVYNIDWTNKHAELGRLLIGSAAERRGGIGSEAVRLALSLARQAGIRDVELEVKANNCAARALYTKLGFVTVAEGDPLKMNLRLD